VKEEEKPRTSTMQPVDRDQLKQKLQETGQWISENFPSYFEDALLDVLEVNEKTARKKKKSISKEKQ